MGVTPRTKSLGVCDLGVSLLYRLDERPFLAVGVHTIIDVAAGLYRAATRRLLIAKQSAASVKQPVVGSGAATAGHYYQSSISKTR